MKQTWWNQIMWLWITLATLESCIWSSSMIHKTSIATTSKAWHTLRICWCVSFFYRNLQNLNQWVPLKMTYTIDGIGLWLKATSFWVCEIDQNKADISVSSNFLYPRSLLLVQDPIIWLMLTGISIFRAK
jgi:multidrug transporter EmrE-like cation transporter